MSKKKRKWWQADLGSLSKQFPNSAKQHTEAGKPIEYLDEDYYYDNYDDWGSQLEEKSSKIKYSDTQKEYNTKYSSYEKTGHWGGYNSYRAPQLSYKYVQQMANALAGQHNITLEVGSSWEVDLIKKKLRYNPASLIYGTKSELLATLLHEIGKLRYMEHYSTLNSKYLAMYKESAAEALFPFEDVRVDYQMLRAYESAAELYESAIPGVQKQIETYKRYADAFKKASVDILKYQLDTIVNVQVSDPNEYKMKLMQTFGTYDLYQVRMRIDEVANYYKNNGCLFDYCGDMLHAMYDLETPTSGFKNIEEKIELTFPAVEPIKKELTSQGTVDIMETSVYPHIEDLLKDLNNKKEEMQKLFPGMLDAVGEMMEKLFKQFMEQELGVPHDSRTKSVTPNTNTLNKNQIRGGSSPTDNNIPPDWLTGDYKELKDSVSQEVRSLVNKLTFLRREEMTVKYQANQKRGKLNSRSLVKHAFGSRRLFRQKLENIDTIQSFAFSVLMDISGSMSENGRKRIVHTTRAMVMFNEVFKKLNIPFELVVFNNNAKVIKSFEQPTDKDIEKKIGGLVSAATGGTNMHLGLEALKIQARPEHNKIVIVLTDGGVGDQAGTLDAQFFTPWREKKGIKSIAFGLEVYGSEEVEVRRMCENTGRVVQSANTLPSEFAELLKTIIKKK